MRVIIDRFEGEFAVVELPDKSFANMPKILVPDSHEGDVIDITINDEETKKQKEEIKDLLNDIFKR